MDPITVDMAEGMKTLRVLPGYSWAPDGRSIVLSQGGRLRRLWIDTDRIQQGSWEPVVDTIPFTARVHRTISEMAWKPMPLSDGPFQSRFHRWWTASPDGQRLAFQAVGRIWLTDLSGGGKPSRLTSSNFQPLEFAPSWSPDGRWLAFTTFDDVERGHVWKIAASGGSPQRLTDEPGEYFNPVWSLDGSYLVVAHGSGATARGRMMSNNAWYDLARLPSDGGPTELIARVPARNGRLIVRASFGPDGRIFYPEIHVEGRESTTRFVSVAADGSDRRVHMTFPFADEAVPSPDGRRVAFQQGGNVYLVPLLSQMTDGKPVHVELRGGKLPVKPLTKDGGMFPRWRNEKTLELGTANFYMRYDVDTEEMSTVEIDLQYPRRIPAGRIAFQGARIVTLENRQVIEKGDVVIDGSRITCVGDCDVSAADEVFDATGKTILPGFWDLHSHHYRDYGGVETRKGFETAIYLAYGITSNLEPYAWSHNVFPVAELVEAGELLGPRTFTTADAFSRGDGPFKNDVTSFEGTEQDVARRKAYGAVFVKQYALPRRDQRQWVVEAARRHGLKVTSEGGDLAANLGMIMDGQTAWEHPLSYVPLHRDAAKFFGKAGATYSPTVIVGGASAWNEEYFFQESEIWRDPKQQRFLSWRYLIPHTRRRMLRPVTDYSFPMIAQGLADIIDEGGYGVPGGHGQHSGLGTHWEIWMYASALGPMGALEVASLHPARYLGVLEDTGSIRVGKLADLLVLRENPLDNIRNTDSIEYVVKGGIVWEGDTLDEVWPDNRPFGEYYWVDEKMLQEDTKPVDHWDKTPR
jgi:hypothetical protein